MEESQVRGGSIRKDEQSRTGGYSCTHEYLILRYFQFNLVRT